jgi:hypothetical protein
VIGARGRDHEQPAIRIQLVAQRKQVVFVHSPAVEQDQHALRIPGGRTDPVGEEI